MASAIRYVSFDCYGTLIDFQMDRVLSGVFGDRVPPNDVGLFCAAAAAYRFDEVLGPYTSYRDVLTRATQRAARRFGISCRSSDTQRVIDAVTTFDPHPEVPEVLQTLSGSVPLVILSNADKDQVAESVARVAAPFHTIIAAEEAGAYKPRLAAFEYMLARLGCSPDEVLHVSASPQYDLRPARDVGIRHTVFVNRGGESPRPWLGYREIEDLWGLLALLPGA